ncbi:MAG: DUF501 domain-containing protein [Propionibacteriaceae bacterium]|nr:DUF501 domain-containing protein [Propionibacteriaceae bacterium]
MEKPTDEDLQIIEQQLGRVPRGVLGIAWRNTQGEPGVIVTHPRVGGKPFPTFYYLTDPDVVKGCSQLESTGYMKELSAQLAENPELAEQYRQAHESYLSDREQIEYVEEISGYSAGGMPDRVKCLHALIAHALAKPGINPIGELAVERLGLR